MVIRITAVRLSGGQDHEHITDLWWTNPGTGESGSSTRAVIVSWIENDKGQAYTEEGGNRADVFVVTPTYGAKYLRTMSDGEWSNNLLALPRS